MTIRQSILITLVCISCAETNRTAEFEDIRVINDAFLQIMDTGFYRTLPPPPHRPTSTNEIDAEISEPITITAIELDNKDKPDGPDLSKIRAKRDSIFNNFDWEKYRRDSITWEKLANNPPYDSSNLVILIFDSLYDYKGNEFIKGIVEPNLFSKNFSVDSTWRPLLLELIDSVQNESLLPINELTKTGRYSLQPYSYDTLAMDRIVGKLWFSRVVYSDEMDRACFHYGFLCGRLCGWGCVVFAEKRNGVWVVISQRELWIA